ncbi:MAG TPA: hypothetical protein GX396_02535 [Tissierellia bacterium]|nr:hypothetical protein [Tissierellia bacterium]
MKKFNFSLQKVLEIKEQLLENLKIELSNLNTEYKNIELAIKKLQGKFYEVEKEYTEKTFKSISPGEISYYKLLMNSILKQIEDNEEKRKIILKKIAAKRQEIINMNMEISSLEKLREKELEKYKKEYMKKEEIFIEEFVSNKNTARKYAI